MLNSKTTDKISKNDIPLQKLNIDSKNKSLDDRLSSLKDVTVPNNNDKVQSVQKTDNNEKKVISVQKTSNKKVIHNKGQKVVHNKGQKDVVDIISKIQQYINRWETLDGKKLYSNANQNILIIGKCNGKKECSITVECMLHYLSGNKTFLSGNRSQCSDVIHKYIKKNEKNKHFMLQLDHLIKLSADQNFIRDVDFYYNLYRFNLSMIKYLFNEKGKIFRAQNQKTQKMLLTNLQEFIKQSLTYLTSFMNRYEVVDPNLLLSSYNLIFLLNELSAYHVNINVPVDVLEKAYKKMVMVVHENILLFKKIKDEKFKSHTTSIFHHEAVTEVDKMVEILSKRTEELEKQRDELKDNLKKINNNQDELKKIVEKDENFKNLIINF